MSYKLKRNKEDYLYYNKGEDRINQIHQWVYRVLSYHKIDTLIKIKALDFENKINESKSIFYRMIDNLVDGFYTYEQGDILGYLIGINAEQFGKERIYNDLYDSLIGKTKKISKSQIKSIDLSKIDTEKEVIKIKKRQYFYGYTSKNEKRKATLEIYTTYKKPRPILRDIKTGRFLKLSKEIKKDFYSDKK